MDFIDRVKAYITPNEKAATAVVVGSVLAILIGSIMLIVSYAVLSPVFTIADTAMNTGTSVYMETAWGASSTVITQALTIVGISMIVAGVAGIIYMLMSVAGMTGGRGRGR